MDDMSEVQKTSPVENNIGKKQRSMRETETGWEEQRLVKKERERGARIPKLAFLFHHKVM